jgi:hypothetical protein
LQLKRIVALKMVLSGARLLDRLEERGFGKGPINDDPQGLDPQGKVGRRLQGHRRALCGSLPTQRVPNQTDDFRCRASLDERQCRESRLLGLPFLAVQSTVMTSFAEFESVFLGALQRERSDLQGLRGASEAQLSAWIEHLFRQYLGYTDSKEIVRGEGALIFIECKLILIECKRPGRLDGPKSQEELDDGKEQLRSNMRAHLDQASIKPKTIMGVVTDGNRWFLMGLNKARRFNTIAEWAFLTDDPRLIAQRLWLLAKPALAQPTPALLESLVQFFLGKFIPKK